MASITERWDERDGRRIVEGQLWLVDSPPLMHYFSESRVLPLVVDSEQPLLIRLQGIRQSHGNDGETYIDARFLWENYFSGGVEE